MQDTENNVVEMVPVISEPDSLEIKLIEEDIVETDKKLEELNTFDVRMSEDVIVQENEWLKERMETNRKDEERLREELFEKQKMLEERRKEQAEGFAQTRQLQLYNQMHEEEQRDIVYSLHGISVDKEQGMKEYKNALYQGSQIILFFADIAIGIATGLTKGWTSVELMTCVALLAAQSTLLPREHKGKLGRSLYSYLSMFFSFLSTPAMVLVMVADKVPYLDFKWIIMGIAGGCVAMCFFGALDYFVRNPYRESWFAARAARSELKELKRTAAKHVKKNQKLRAKLIAKLTKRKEKQETRISKIKDKEERRYIKAKEREEFKAYKLNEKLEKQAKMRERMDEVDALALENRNKKKALKEAQIVNFKSRINSVFNKKAN